MTITTDPNHPELRQPGENGQNKAYLALSDAERARGFVRPVRLSYVHVGRPRPDNLRDLTAEETERYAQLGYVKFAPNTDPDRPEITGRFWTEADLKSGCGAETTMSLSIAETYARQPNFYGATFCTGCGRHHPVEEFVWAGAPHQRVGS